MVIYSRYEAFRPEEAPRQKTNLEVMIEQLAADSERLGKFDERVRTIATPKVLIPTYTLRATRRFHKEGHFDSSGLAAFMYGIAVLHESLLLYGYFALGYIGYDILTKS